MKIFGFFVDKSKRLMPLVIVLVLLASAVGVVSSYESGEDCIAYLYADPDSITADGKSITTIYFKVTCPGKCGLSLVPDIGTLKLDTVFVEDKPMEATYTAPTTQELGDYKDVTLTFTHRDSGESKSVTISLVPEDCSLYCRNKFDHGIWDRESEYPDCGCICEKGWEMRAEGCVECYDICKEKGEHYVYDPDESDDNICECKCEDG